MQEKEAPRLKSLSPAELRKRKRERLAAFLLLVLFGLSTLFQAFVSEHSKSYGFFQSLLYFGLLHLNVILVMLLVFLVSRNLIKAYLMRKTGGIGSSLRWKMVTSLVAFSLFPSLILFLGSTYIIRQGFDQWFGGQVSVALSDSTKIVDAHYEKIRKNLYFYGRDLKNNLKGRAGFTSADLKRWVYKFPIASVEQYKSAVDEPLWALQEQFSGLKLARVPAALLEKAFLGEDQYYIRKMGKGDLVQYIVPVRLSQKRFVYVLSEHVPLALKTRMEHLKKELLGYEKTRSLKNSLKTHYTLIILTLFVLTLFVVSWFGLYVTREVTEPVSDLLRATDAIREGNWNYRIEGVSVDSKSTAADLEILKSAFNLMAAEVGRRGAQLENANDQLRGVVQEIEERERYLEILLSSIRRGVLVLDLDQNIQRINREALEFAHEKYRKVLNPFSLIGQDWRHVYRNFGSDAEGEAFLEKVKVRSGKPIDKVFELSFGIGRSASTQSVRTTGIFLKDPSSEALGWMIILEDVSVPARMERLAAWQGVARRVAHEIKNPLTPIQISADRMRRRMQRENRSVEEDQIIFEECLTQIQKQVRVIRDLVREFSQFAKMPEPKFERLDIVAHITDILKDYRFTRPEYKFVLKNHLNDKEFFINADAEHMRSLVVNLTDNALHSMEEERQQNPENGKEYKFLVELKSIEEGGAVSVSFIDNGPGITASMRKKVFDPYVSAKASGLGLGLAIVRRTAEEHRGRIRCEAAEGGCFVLELPRLIEETGVSDV